MKHLPASPINLHTYRTHSHAFVQIAFAYTHGRISTFGRNQVSALQAVLPASMDLPPVSGAWPPPPRQGFGLAAETSAAPSAAPQSFGLAAETASAGAAMPRAPVQSFGLAAETGSAAPRAPAESFGLAAETRGARSSSPTLPLPPAPRSGGFGLNAELGAAPQPKPGGPTPAAGGYGLSAEVASTDARSRTAASYDPYAQGPGLRPVLGGLDQNAPLGPPLLGASPQLQQQPWQVMAANQSAPRVAPGQLDHAADVMTRRPPMVREWCTRVNVML